MFSPSPTRVTAEINHQRPDFLKKKECSIQLVWLHPVTSVTANTIKDAR